MRDGSTPSVRKPPGVLRKLHHHRWSLTGRLRSLLLLRLLQHRLPNHLRSIWTGRPLSLCLSRLLLKTLPETSMRRLPAFKTLISS